MNCPATSSGRLTAAAAVSAAPGRLRGLIVEADGTNAATITIYDNASAASGTILAKVIIPAAGRFASPNLPSEGIVSLAGLYCDISGTGAAAIVLYDRG